jgi:hypothetical protein
LVHVQVHVLLLLALLVNERGHFEGGGRGEGGVRCGVVYVD